MVKVTAGKIRELSVAASCDPRTIIRVLKGGAVESMSAERALKAIREAGLEPAKIENHHIGEAGAA